MPTLPTLAAGLTLNQLSCKSSHVSSNHVPFRHLLQLGNVSFMTMATAFTSGASLPPSTLTTDQWESATTHGDSNPDLDSPPGVFDDDPSAYEPLSPANGHADHHTNGTTNGHLAPTPSPTFPPRRSSLLPDPSRAPLPIALRASFLSLVLGIGTLSTIHLLYHSHPLWRIPFFASTLSLFHLLEFYITALYNPPAATVSAFLLDNGRAYNIAHAAAFLECFLHFAPFFPWSSSSSSSSFTLTPTQPQPPSPPSNPYPALLTHPASLALGLTLLTLGQLVRSTAMAHAGLNFNHIVQSEKHPSHTLVTSGIYSVLRHPSYFGFFWWSLGTQVVLGNVVCLVGFAVVLGRFFRRRVRREEELLVGFFGEGYVAYRGGTWVGVPFVG